MGKRKIDGTHKTQHAVNEHGLVMPRAGRGRKHVKTLGYLGDDHFTPFGVRSPLHGDTPRGAIGRGGTATREEEIQAIDDFLERVGATHCPSGACRGAYGRDEQPEPMMDRHVLNRWPFFPVPLFVVTPRHVDFVAVRTKRFEAMGALPAVTFRRRVMASEFILCPVCERLYETRPKGRCVDCGHAMRRKNATQKEMNAWLKKFDTLPLNRRTYRGFTYDDFQKFVSDSCHREPSFNDVSLAFNQLFSSSMEIKGDETWLRLMVAYELQRRFVYSKGEPDRVYKRRMEIRQGRIPADINELIQYKQNAKTKKTEERKMAKKQTAVGGKKSSVNFMGYPGTAVVRWLTKEGCSRAVIRGVFEMMGVRISDGTIGGHMAIANNGFQWKDHPRPPADFNKTEIAAVRKLVKLTTAALDTEEESTKKTTAKKTTAKKKPPRKVAKKKTVTKKAGNGSTVKKVARKEPTKKTTAKKKPPRKRAAK